MKHAISLAIVLFIAQPSTSQDTGVLLTPERIFTFDSADEFSEYPGGRTLENTPPRWGFGYVAVIASRGVARWL